MLSNIIKRFTKSFKKYMFSYKKGFYVIPYLANSPESTVESFKHTPFVNWDEEKNLLTQKSPFMDGIAYFYKIEDGLWIFLNKVAYKVNLEFKMYYDDDLPADYYLFSYNLVKHPSKNKIGLINGLSYQTFSWNLFKPKGGLNLAYFKNSEISSVGLYISKTWFANNISQFPEYNQSHLESFMNSEDLCTLWPELENNILYQEVLLELLKENHSGTALKQFADSILNYLIKNYDISHNQSEKKIESDTHRTLIHIEKMLNDHLLSKFPGIEELAKKAGMSPTKLKTDFKRYYGEPIYQYYLRKQMDYAYILLRDKNMKVGEVAKLLDYQSEGKFTVAFKEKFGVLPSKVISHVEI